MDAKKLYEQLKPLQEKQGYFFNADMEHTMALMQSLITQKETYGYMACPCRLANGEFEDDRDIICPCTYREADVKEFGACYCGLYVSEAWNRDKIDHEVVPERRPAHLIKF